MGAAMSTAIEHPRMRWMDVSSQLVDFAMTTYDVETSALAALLPEGFVPELGTVAGGGERGFVSAVTFVNTELYAAFAPFVRLRCHQTNYRAYVRHRGERGVWFFGTHLASPFVLLPRYGWRLPWSRSHVVASATWNASGLCRRYEWRGRGGQGEEILVARGTGRPIGALPSFGDDATNRLVLTHPFRGWLRRRGGSVATYSVWHPPLEMEDCAVEEARFERFERLGLIRPDQPPCSVLAQRLTQYIVRLPPRSLARIGGAQVPESQSLHGSRSSHAPAAIVRSSRSDFSPSEVNVSQTTAPSPFGSPLRAKRAQ